MHPPAHLDTPTRARLPAGLRLGPVRLQVADLSRSLAWYERILGLAVRRDGNRAQLAAPGGDRALIELNEHPGARPHPRRGRLGLYHFAVLLPERAALGRFLRHLSAQHVRAGAADHLVSEALYLTDPDGLGIEVYADRPRDTWRVVDGEIAMASEPLDAAGLLDAAGAANWSGAPADTVIGHVHLHVGSLDAASAFYAHALGFDTTASRYPGARFLGAGGYHHHLGVNVWAGPDAEPPQPDEAQLLEWSIELPGAADVAEAERRLRDGGYAAQLGRGADDGHGSVLVSDPWGTRVRLSPIR